MDKVSYLTEWENGVVTTTMYINNKQVAKESKKVKDITKESDYFFSDHQHKLSQAVLGAVDAWLFCKLKN